MTTIGVVFVRMALGSADCDPICLSPDRRRGQLGLEERYNSNPLLGAKLAIGTIFRWCLHLPRS